MIIVNDIQAFQRKTIRHLPPPWDIHLSHRTSRNRRGGGSISSIRPKLIPSPRLLPTSRRTPCAGRTRHLNRALTRDPVPASLDPDRECGRSLEEPGGAGGADWKESV
jgi:hypothetical protein